MPGALVGLARAPRTVLPVLVHVELVLVVSEVGVQKQPVVHGVVPVQGPREVAPAEADVGARVGGLRIVGVAGEGVNIATALVGAQVQAVALAELPVEVVEVVAQRTGLLFAGQLRPHKW